MARSQRPPRVSRPIDTKSQERRTQAKGAVPLTPPPMVRRFTELDKKVLMPHHQNVQAAIEGRVRAFVALLAGHGIDSDEWECQFTPDGEGYTMRRRTGSPQATPQVGPAPTPYTPRKESKTRAAAREAAKQQLALLHGDKDAAKAEAEATGGG